MPKLLHFYKKENYARFYTFTKRKIMQGFLQPNINMPRRHHFHPHKVPQIRQIRVTWVSICDVEAPSSNPPTAPS